LLLAVFCLSKQEKIKKTKSIIFSVIVLLLTLYQLIYSGSVNAQWIQQNAPTTSALLRVSFLNKNTGWACGMNGTMLKTTNGGSNWILQTTNITGKELRSINIIDSNILYSVGFFETIIKTTNGGQNWNIIRDGQVGNGNSFWSSYFINSNTGWICGSGSLIFKTTNGGITFDSVSVPTGYLYDIYFRNPLEGLACGDGAAMYKTTNGGLNWYYITVPVGTQASRFKQFSFINNNTGFIVGQENNKLYKTVNFGTSWDSISRAQLMDDTYTLFFANEYTGWIGGSFGLMCKTTNGGYNWYSENVSQFGSGYFGDLFFLNDTVGWAVGAVGKILYTETGGQITKISNNNSVTSGFELFQNYPNPFNHTTIIKYQIKDGYKNQLVAVKLIIYDAAGREIKTLVNQKQPAGVFEVKFDVGNLSSGIYYYKIISENFVSTKKFIIIK
jgi:photosystem II stability/assembly factor-like uncharacterized protein